MVLVLHQMLVSGILYLLNKLGVGVKNRCGDHGTANSVLAAEITQENHPVIECLADLSYVNDLPGLNHLVERLLRVFLPGLAIIRNGNRTELSPFRTFDCNHTIDNKIGDCKVQCDVLVFLLNPQSNELEIMREQEINKTKLPKEGIVRQCLEWRSSMQVQSSDVYSHDPILALMQGSPSQLGNNQIVTLSAVYNNEDKAVAFFVIVSSQHKDNLIPVVNLAEKQILNCYNRIKQNFTNDLDFRRHKKFLEAFGMLCVPNIEMFSKKLVDFVVQETNAESGVALILDQTSAELCNKYEFSGPRKERRIEVKGSIFEEVVTDKKLLNAHGITKDTKLRFDLVRITDSYVQSMLCVPVVNPNSHSSAEAVIAIVCLFNKHNPEEKFGEVDEENVRFFCDHSAVVMQNTLTWEREMLIKRQQQNLLKVARNLFNHVDDVGILLNEIMTEARSLTNAERCSLFLLDRERNELVAKVFDGEDMQGNNNKKENIDVRIPASQGIAGHVTTTGKLLNIKDAYSHPLFYRGLDDKTGFRTRNILCFPIKDETGVIGVAELCNKINGACFTKFDEDLTKGFAIYCGVSVFHSLLYDKAVESQLRHRLTNELMIYHMKVTPNEVENINVEEICSPGRINQAFSRFDFMPRTIADEQTVAACLCMFQDLGFIERWKIPREILIRFVLMVKRGYRDPPYHNWMHAFTVAHFCYLLFKNVRIVEYVRDLEMLALFVACLCHDIDHRGTNNAFQVNSNSPLASLYSSEGSVLERHHFAQTMCILNTEGCNIFKNLSRQDYEEMLDLIRKIILATDLSHHLRILKNIRRMATDGFNVDRDDHRELLLFLMMTSSDLSDQTKPWEGTRKTADLIYTEFFSQGDMEKAEGWTPNEMMDRDRAHIPQLQVQFIDSIALPVYSLLHALLPDTRPVVEAVRSVREQWRLVQEEGEQNKENS